MTIQPSFGDKTTVSVDRTTAELRQGRPIKIMQQGTAILCVSLETIPPVLLEQLLASSASCSHPELVISAERARHLGLEATGPLSLKLAGQELADHCIRLGMSPEVDNIIVEPAGMTLETLPAHDLQLAALKLMKYARLMPTFITLPWEDKFEHNFETLAVDATAINNYPALRAEEVVQISEAPVPLQDSEDTRFVLFRSADGSAEHLAIIIGSPDFSQPILTRLHSACLTGDLFGSLRCDCGDQLRNAVAQLRAEGGGMLLYLAQEGRNIGLANKLRAYKLQYQGLNTVKADELLGFCQDERYYDVAAAMLHHYGVKQVRLLTNNPTKINALTDHGIEVIERVAVTGTTNPHNQNYLETKKNIGHLL